MTKTERIGFDSQLGRFTQAALARQTREVLSSKKRIVVTKPAAELRRETDGGGK